MLMRLNEDRPFVGSVTPLILPVPDTWHSRGLRTMPVGPFTVQLCSKRCLAPMLYPVQRGGASTPGAVQQVSKALSSAATRHRILAAHFDHHVVEQRSKKCTVSQRSATTAASRSVVVS